MNTQDVVNSLESLGINVEGSDAGFEIYAFDKVDDRMIDLIAKLPNIVELSFTVDAAPSDLQLGRLSSLTSLKKLEMTFGHPGSGLSCVRGMMDLEDVKCATTDEGVAWLKTAPSLRRLDLAYSKISDSALEDIGAISLLEELNLDSTDISGSLAPLCGLSHLTDISLQGTAISDSSLIDLLSRFKALRLLTTMIISDTRISDVCLKAISEATALRSLGLSNTLVTYVGLRELIGKVFLDDLFLCGIDIGRKEIDVICELQGLRNLWISRSRLSGDGDTILRKRLPSCEILRSDK